MFRQPAQGFNQEEVIFIIEGNYELTVGDQTSTAGPGTLVFIPRNVVHRFRNVGDKTGCMLDWTLPGGQDHYFKAISEVPFGISWIAVLPFPVR